MYEYLFNICLSSKYFINAIVDLRGYIYESLNYIFIASKAYLFFCDRSVY